MIGNDWITLTYKKVANLSDNTLDKSQIAFSIHDDGFFACVADNWVRLSLYADIKYATR